MAMNSSNVQCSYYANPHSYVNNCCWVTNFRKWRLNNWNAQIAQLSQICATFCTGAALTHLPSVSPHLHYYCSMLIMKWVRWEHLIFVQGWAQWSRRKEALFWDTSHWPMVLVHGHFLTTHDQMETLFVFWSVLGAAICQSENQNKTFIIVTLLSTLYARQILASFYLEIYIEQHPSCVLIRTYI
jgi:hypothetical protein